MSARQLNILIDELRNDGSNIVRRDVLSDLDRKYTNKDRSWLWKKWIFVSVVWIVNAGLVLSVMFTRWGIYLVYPFITLPHIRDVIYVLATVGSIVFKRYTAMWGHISNKPLEHSQVTVASLVTCYSEDYKSVKDNINNLMHVTNSNQGIRVTNLVVCVCDGLVIGKKNDKPLCDIFIEEMDVIQPPVVRVYETWKGDLCKSELYFGTYGEASYTSNHRLLLIKKYKNHGKKDGLLLAKGIINDINAGKIVLEGIELPIKYVYSTDADTVTHKGSLERGIEWMELYPELDAGVFILRVKFHTERVCNWFWDHFQNFQYFSSQFVRRGAESVFAKVTCLSGSGNICRVSSQSYQYANKRYAEYPRTTSLMDVAPKMIGTDRRYTTLKLKYSRDVKLVMLYDTVVETETPQNMRTYISQRKRWGTNTLSNSLVNIGSRNIPWYTKLSGIVDILRLIGSYFRFTSYFYFWGFLIYGKINPAILIFVGATVGLVYIYTFVAILIKGDKRLSLLYGFIVNKMLNPLLTVRIFTEILLNFDDFKWGSTQQIKGTLDQPFEQFKNGSGISNFDDIEQGVQPDTNELVNYNKYEHIEDAEETEDGVLFIHPRERRKRRKRRNPKPTKSPTPTNIFEDTNNTLSSMDKDIPMRQSDIYKQNILRIPKSLKEIDNIDCTDESISEVETKYSKAWNDKHFPKHSTHTNDKSDESCITIGGAQLIPPAPPPPPPPAPQDFSTHLTHPRKKIRKLHWKPLAPDMLKKTFWKLSKSTLIDISSSEDGDCTQTEMEKLFEISESKKIIGHKKRLLTLVSLKRANNAGIVLSKIRRKFNTDDECLDVIMKALVYLNPQQISMDQLVSFLRFFPLADEEKENLHNFKGEREIIFADKFFVQTLIIPRLPGRIQSEIIKRTTKNRLHRINKDCTIVQNVCVELKESSKFKKFMSIVLKMGKILNKDSPITTSGFKLESLLLLKETRVTQATRGSVKTLLDYIIKKVKKNKPDLLLFIQDMPSLKKIGDISITALKQSQSHIKQDISFMRQEINIAIKHDRTKEKTASRKMYHIFLQNYHKFYKNVKILSKQSNEKIEDTENVTKETMEYYGEKYSDISAQQFFSIIIQFIRDVENNSVFLQ